MVSRQRIGRSLLVASLTLIMLVTSGPAPTALAHPKTPARMLLFARASERSGVPLPVLVGLAWEQSMISDHGGKPSIDHGYGLLDLSARPGHDTLGAAAQLLHLKPAKLRQNDSFNLLGGALLLARIEGGLDRGHLPRSIDAWSAAVVHFTGMRSRLAAALIVADMYRALVHGIRAGGVVQAPLTGLPAAASSLRPMQPMTQSRATSGTADYPGATWEPANSSNFTVAQRPSDHPIRYIVIHDTESSCAAAVSWFQNPAAQSSAHYVVCLDGTIIQTVHEQDIAWHAGNWPINQESIGIEHEGYADGDYYTRAQYLASAALVRYLTHKYGLSPNRSVIFGHENVPWANHTDPGPSWNWDYYLQQVRGGGASYDGGMTAIGMVNTLATARTCPSTDCPVIGSANWGEEFYIRSQQPGWDSIWYGGAAAWIPSDELSAGSGTAVRIRSGAPVLAGPGGGTAVVGTVHAGETYVSLETNGKYRYIFFNHRYGFVSNSAVSVTSCPGARYASGPVASACEISSESGIALLPNEGSPGSAITVNERGLNPEATVSVLLNGQSVGTGTVNSGGFLSSAFYIPNTATPGIDDVTITGGHASAQPASLAVQPAPSTPPVVVSSPAATMPGANLSLTAVNFPPNRAISLTASFQSVGGTVSTTRTSSPSGPHGSMQPVTMRVPSGAGASTATITAGVDGVKATATTLVQPVPPTLVTIPAAVVPGQRVVVQGFDFAPHESLALHIGSGSKTAAQPGAQGRFIASLNVPQDAAGSVPVAAVSSGIVQASAQVPVEAALSRSQYFFAPAGNQKVELHLLNPASSVSRATVQVVSGTAAVKSTTYKVSAHTDRVVTLAGASRSEPVGISVSTDGAIEAELQIRDNPSTFSPAVTPRLHTALEFTGGKPGGHDGMAVFNPTAQSVTLQVGTHASVAASGVQQVNVPSDGISVIPVPAGSVKTPTFVMIDSPVAVPVAGLVAGSSAPVPSMVVGGPDQQQTFFPAVGGSRSVSTRVVVGNPGSGSIGVTLQRFSVAGKPARSAHHSVAGYSQATFTLGSEPGGDSVSVQTTGAGFVSRLSGSSGTRLEDRGDGPASSTWSMIFPHAAGESGPLARMSLFNPGASAVGVLMQSMTASGKAVYGSFIVAPHSTTVIAPGKSSRRTIGFILSASGTIVPEEYLLATSGGLASVLPGLAATSGPG